MDTSPNLLIISFFLYQLFVHNTTLTASVSGLQIPDKPPTANTLSYACMQAGSHICNYRPIRINKYIQCCIILKLNSYVQYIMVHAEAHTQPDRYMCTHLPPPLSSIQSLRGTNYSSNGGLCVREGGMSEVSGCSHICHLLN